MPTNSGLRVASTKSNAYRPFTHRWPLLTGERAHYEIAAGNYSSAQRLLCTIENYANEIGLFPEQIWDSEDITELELFLGKPSGSAMPLAWAHAEYLKLCRSIKSRRIFDMPQQTRQRYLIDKIKSNIFTWNFGNKFKSIPKYRTLRIQSHAMATVRWTTDNWLTYQDTTTLDSGLGVHYADLPIINLDPGQEIIYTFYWNESENWENKNFTLTLEKSDEVTNEAEAVLA